MFFSALFVGLFNILYRILMGRLLSPDEFGEFGALYALFFYISFIGTKTIRVAVTSLISDNLYKRNEISIRSIYKRYLLIVSIIGIFIALGLIIMSPKISNFLKIQDPFLIILVAFAVFLSWIVPINLGTFQGFQRFSLIAFTNLFNVIMKIIVGIFLVLIGFSIYGAIGGMIFGYLIAAFISLLLIIKILRNGGTSQRIGSFFKKEFKPSHFIENKSQFLLVFNIFIAVIGLTTLTNIDVVIVKHFFSSSDTASYTAASLVGRFIYFFPVGFITVMYPKVVQKRHDYYGSFLIFRKAMLYTVVPTLGIVLISIIFPSQLLKLMYGDQYQDAVNIVMLLSPMMLIFSITSVIVNFLLAIRKYQYIYIFTGISLLQIVTIWIIHPTIITILWILIITNIFNFIIAGLYIYLKFKRRKTFKVGCNE